MKKNIINKIIIIIAIISATLEIGITIGCYIVANKDFNKFNTSYNIELAE